MLRITSPKIKLLILYDLLCKLTDENNALNTDQIIALLAEKNIAVSSGLGIKDESQNFLD